MTKKSVREMNNHERVRHSLNFKMSRMLIIMAALIAVVAILFSYTLYSLSVNREYKNSAYELSQTATVLLSRLAVQQYAKRTLEKYAAFSDEEQMDQFSENYKSAFEGIEDYGYDLMADKLRILQKYNNAMSVYIAALDTEKMRMIYVVDSDDSESHCTPGTWEDITEEELAVYQGDTEASMLERYIGLEASGEAYIDHHPDYGYICTAGVVVMEVNGYYVGAFTDLDMGKTISVSVAFLWQYALILLILIGVIVFITNKYVKKTIVGPINRLADAAVSYSNDKRDNIEAEGHFVGLNIKTGDEIENLSLIMHDMEGDINNYITNLTAVTVEKERISTELDVARKIQESMVSHDYPPFPERKEFDIFATMNTAKEVGGDFYDYFLMDDDHLAFLIADVSGKGIPAALFMMASKILIKNFSTIMGRSPAAILEKVNNEVSKNNNAEMFVTVWLGVLEISTGKLTAANAGHEVPVVKRKDGIYDLYKDPHGFILGGMEGMVYKNYTIDLHPGDSIFVYTDGVTEATNSRKELFGENRLLISLNKHREERITEMLYAIKRDLDDFKGEAPQFDDITMMCMHYFGTEKE